MKELGSIGGWGTPGIHHCLHLGGNGLYTDIVKLSKGYQSQMADSHLGLASDVQLDLVNGKYFSTDLNIRGTTKVCSLLFTGNEFVANK